MSYVTVPNRPLLSVGTWNASTGEEVITDQDLAEIVAASQSGVLDSAVIKKGHVDNRYSEFNEDGSPAFGQVTNLRVVDGTLYGDFVNVPASLAESLASAYPHVSVELARNVKLRDAQGNVAHAFGVVLTAAALLGATAPAVKGLSQKAYLFAEDAYDYTTLMPEAATHFAEKKAAKKTTEKAEAPAEEPPAPQESDVDNTLTDVPPPPAPAPVKDDTPEEAGEKGDDTPNVSPRAAEIPDSSTEAPAPAPPATAPPEGVPTMPNIDEQAAQLRRKYDLPENASYKDLLAKVLDEKVVAGVRQEPILDVAPGTDETPNPEIAEQIHDETAERQKHNLSEAAEAPVVELDNVYVSKSAFSELMSDYEATKAKLAAREKAEVAARRDRMVTSWFRQGLIHKDERSKIREQLDVAEETVVALTESRTPIYSTTEIGHAKNDEAHFAESTDETRTEQLYKADDAIFGA